MLAAVQFDDQAVFGAQKVGDAPVGSAPLTGSADEDGGEGSEIRRRRRTILGAANVRWPMLSSAFGARFLGR